MRTAVLVLALGPAGCAKPQPVEVPAAPEPKAEAEANQ